MYMNTLICIRFHFRGYNNKHQALIWSLCFYQTRKSLIWSKLKDSKAFFLLLSVTTEISYPLLLKVKFSLESIKPLNAAFSLLIYPLCNQYFKHLILTRPHQVFLIISLFHFIRLSSGHQYFKHHYY